MNINEICIAFENEFIDGKNKSITKGMLKRFFKKIVVTYKRVRRSILKNSKWKTYWKKVSQIKSIRKFEKQELCDLYFFDESGFSLDLNILYTWIRGKEPTKIPLN